MEELQPVQDVNTGSFTDTFEGAVDFFNNGHEFMKQFFDCIPEPVQELLFMVFVISFGFAFLLKIVRTLT